MCEIAIKDLISIIDLIWKFLAVIITAIIGLKFLRTLTPCINLDIIKKDTYEDCILIGVKISNVSRIGVTKKYISLVVTEVPIFNLSNSNNDSNLLRDEWIDFKGATEIFKSTKTIDPKEDLYLERIYKLKPDEVLHVGVQIRVVAPRLSRLLSALWPYTSRWTLTKYLK